MNRNGGISILWKQRRGIFTKYLKLIIHGENSPSHYHIATKTKMPTFVRSRIEGTFVFFIHTSFYETYPEESSIILGKTRPQDKPLHEPTGSKFIDAQLIIFASNLIFTW